MYFQSMLPDQFKLDEFNQEYFPAQRGLNMIRINLHIRYTIFCKLKELTDQQTYVCTLRTLICKPWFYLKAAKIGCISF